MMINKIFIAAFLCNIAAFVFGTTITWSSPVLSKLTSNDLDDNPFGRAITDDESSWISSSLSLGSLSTPLLWGYSTNKIGRKWTLFLICIPISIAYLILAFAEVIELYYFGRLLVGMALCGAYVTIPMYLGEIAEDQNRGAIGALFICFINAGSLYSYCVGPYIPLLWFNLSLAILPVISAVLSIFFISESPHYYLKKGDKQHGEQILQKLRGDNYKSEMSAIEEMMNESQTGSISGFFQSKPLRKALIIALSLFFFHELSGVLAVLSYTQTIFEDAGSTLDSAVSGIIIGVVQFVSSSVTPLVSDRLGRKLVLLISAIGMIISEVPLGVYFYLKDDNQDVSNIGWLPIVSLMVYIIVYNFGFAGIPWAMLGELFPANYKSYAVSIVEFVNGILGFLVSKFFPNLVDAIGMGPTFWIFSGCCCGAALFVLFVVFETKGKSLQEIQKALKS